MLRSTINFAKEGWLVVSSITSHLGMWCRMGVASRSVWFSLWVSVWQTNISSRMTHILPTGVSTNIYNCGEAL